MRTLASDDMRVIVAWIDRQRYASFTDAGHDTDQYLRKYMLARYQFLDAERAVVYDPDTDLLLEAVKHKQIGAQN